MLGWIITFGGMALSLAGWTGLVSRKRPQHWIVSRYKEDVIANALGIIIVFIGVFITL